MAQHDYVIDNSTGANVRSDINSVLQAIASNNSGSSAPSTTVASQFFADTNAGIMKLRNTSNNGYVNLFTLAGGIDVDAASTFSEDVTFEGATRAITFDKSADALEFGDEMKATFGNSGDLSISHSGTASQIQEVGTGSLHITTNGTLISIDKGATESMANFKTDGAVELFFDNTKRIETLTDGAKVTGKLAVIGDNGITIEATSTNTAGQLTIIGVNNSDQVSAITRIKSVSTDSSSAATATTFSNRDSSNNVNEHLRIDSSGRVGIATVSPDHLLHCVAASSVMKIDHTSTGDTTGIVMRHRRGNLSGFSGKMISFTGNANTEVGTIRIGLSSTSYNTSSDYRLKENATAISDGITRLKTLKPYKFNWISDDTNTPVDGFFAHEVSSAVPEAITGTKDAVDSNNKPVHQEIDQSKLVPLLVAAVQELIGKVEALEAA